ncbi:MAG: TniQ family protein [Clostridiales bacterium]|nr:TniQ family protein [Clostridiales bacterium]
MIGILPRLYEDELLYSFLSRYAVTVAGNTYRGVSEDLYTDPLCCPNILLLNHMKEDLLSKLEPQASLREIVLNHTMFSWFCRFARKERRDKAFKLATEMNIKKLYDSLPIPNYTDRYKERRTIKYCPDCAQEQRTQFGEAYFQRFNQIFELTLCPIHHCKLHRTSIAIDGRVSPAFITAEMVIPKENEIVYSESELGIRVAEYLLDVLNQPLDIENKSDVGIYLDYRLRDRGYVKSNGTRDMGKLTNDFNAFYADIGVKREYWFLQKLFSHYVYNAYEISLMGLFLNISTKELCEHKL